MSQATGTAPTRGERAEDSTSPRRRPPAPARGPDVSRFRQVASAGSRAGADALGELLPQASDDALHRRRGHRVTPEVRIGDGVEQAAPDVDEVEADLPGESTRVIASRRARRKLVLPHRASPQTYRCCVSGASRSKGTGRRSASPIPSGISLAASTPPSPGCRGGR